MQATASKAAGDLLAFELSDPVLRVEFVGYEPHCVSATAFSSGPLTPREGANNGMDAAGVQASPGRNLVERRSGGMADAAPPSSPCPRRFR